MTQHFFHTDIELFCAFLGLCIFWRSIGRYNKSKTVASINGGEPNTAFLWMALFGGSVFVLDGLHGVLSGFFGSSLANASGWIASTWLVSLCMQPVILLSLFLSPRIKGVYVGIIVISMAAISSFMMMGIDYGYYQDIVLFDSIHIGRPQELINVGMNGYAAWIIWLMRKEQPLIWKFLFWAVFINMATGFVMSLSRFLYTSPVWETDLQFHIAHVLKLISLIPILSSLLVKPKKV